MKKRARTVEDYLKAFRLQIFAEHSNLIETVDRSDMTPVALQSAHRGGQLFGSAHFHTVSHMRDSQRSGSLNLSRRHSRGICRIGGATHRSEALLGFS
jgi:hypothetical protein